MITTETISEHPDQAPDVIMCHIQKKRTSKKEITLQIGK